MVDYKAWGTVDPISVEDAAYLWAGIDPSTYSFSLTTEQRGAFTARLKMLTVRIQSKTLSANTDSNPAAFIGVHDKSLVARADLRIVASALGERPAFLFFNEPPDGPASLVEKRALGEVFSTDEQKRARQLQAIETLSHRPGSPRRISQAPPPPATVGGGEVVWVFPPKEVGRALTDQSLGAAAGTVDSAQAREQWPADDAPKTTPSTADVERGAGNGPSTAPKRSGRQATKATQAEHDRWMKARVKKLLAAGGQSNSLEDEEAVRAEPPDGLGSRSDRIMVRVARKAHAPARWQKTDVRRQK